MKSLIAALRFLTRIPAPGPATTLADLIWSVAWFPLIGAGIGWCLAASTNWLAHYFPLTIAGVLAIALILMLTGGFHEDAVADSADGLGGGYDTPTVLKILHDSRVGTYGVLALWVLLMLRWGALTTAPTQAYLIFPLAMLWGRWTAGPLLALLKPLSDGLAKDIHSRHPGPALVATIFTVAGTAWIYHAGCTRAWIAAGVAVTLTALWGLYLQRRLSGQSGDLLGAGNQLVEAAVILTCLADVVPLTQAV